MPDSFHNFERFTLNTLGWVGGAERVRPLPEESERKIVAAMVSDLEGLKVKVSHCIDCSRETGGGGAAKKYVVIGGSNGRKTAEALVRQGREVMTITEGGWRINDESVKVLAERVKRDVDSTWVAVFQVFDNSVYFVEGEDGEFYLPRKGENNRYHVDGALTLATPSQVQKTFRSQFCRF